jgi:hypothetical protein
MGNSNEPPIIIIHSDSKIVSLVEALSTPGPSPDSPLSDGHPSSRNPSRWTFEVNEGVTG